MQPDRHCPPTKALRRSGLEARDVAGSRVCPCLSDKGKAGEHEVELLLNCRLPGSRRGPVHGKLCYLVQWLGYTSADDTWLLLDELAQWHTVQRRWPSV